MFVDVRAQQDSLYTLTGYLGAGMTYCTSSFDDVPTGLNRVGFNGTARMMWHPEHYLAVGGEFGLTNFYSIERTDTNMAGAPTNVRSVLNGFPLLIDVSMTPVKNLSVLLAFGVTMMRSNVHQDGTPDVSVGSVSTTGMLGVNYVVPIGEKSYLGAELDLMAVDRYNDKLIKFGLIFAYDALRY